MKQLIIVIFVLIPKSVFAESATAQVLLTVIKPLQIQAISNLIFPTASAGSNSASIAPGTIDNENNASFQATGEPDTAFTISHPDTTTMITGSGSENEVIQINSIQTSPAKGANGYFDSSGEQMIYLGASRDSLSADQVQGEYVGHITVSIVY